jgi:phage baseplate assembly protein W
MALTQRYGIKYPFTSDNDDEIYVDLNSDYKKSIESQVLHVVFTPKGQRLRDPEFGSDFIKYLFEPNDGATEDAVKSSIKESISRYVPNVEFKDIETMKDPSTENSIIVTITYTIKMGAYEEENKVSLKI